MKSPAYNILRERLAAGLLALVTLAGATACKGTEYPLVPHDIEVPTSPSQLLTPEPRTGQ